MKRRTFIAGLGGAAAWPVVVRAQQPDSMRRVGMLIASVENDPQVQKRLTVFREALGRLGWQEGRNLRTELRFRIGAIERMHAGAAELVSKGPDVILVTSTPAANAVRRLDPAVPIVFTTVNDPVASGLVGNLAHPESNSTGFANYEASIGGKWVELLKEAAPRVERIALIFNPGTAPETYQSSIEGAARKLGTQVIKVPVGDAIDIVRGIDMFAIEPNGGLLLLPDNTMSAYRQTIFRLAVQHRLPAIYWAKFYATEGGLMAYGVEPADLYRGAATYVDRILRGAMVSELPVQFPSKFDLVINLKTAKDIGLTIPESFLLRADELID
jgi:putative ABC transport system substrate-binding protein